MFEIFIIALLVLWTWYGWNDCKGLRADSPDNEPIDFTLLCFVAGPRGWLIWFDYLMIELMVFCLYVFMECRKEWRRHKKSQ